MARYRQVLPYPAWDGKTPPKWPGDFWANRSTTLVQEATAAVETLVAADAARKIGEQLRLRCLRRAP